MHQHKSLARTPVVLKRFAAVLVPLCVVLTACSGTSTNSGADPASPSSAPSSASTSPSPTQSQRAVPLLRENCNDSDNICHYAAGTYQLGHHRENDHFGGVIPGLQLSLPKGWTGINEVGELSLTPPGHPQAHLFIWTGMQMVKSSGQGVEKKILSNVGESAKAISTYLVNNPDFDVVSQPAPVTIGDGIETTSLVVRASDTVNFGLPSCPYHGKCVGLFTNPQYWDGGAYSIGGPEQLRLYLVTFHANLPTFLHTDNTHTMIIGLQTENATALHTFTKQAQPILHSLRLPAKT